MVPSKKQIAKIKSGMFFLALLPLARLFWLGLTDNLGANPVEFVERSTGTWTLVILLITLSLTPLRLIYGVSWPLQLRRMAGLFMFFYACLHFLTYLWLDHWFDWEAIVADIVKHPYVLVGFSAFILSIPLAVTSNDTLIRVLKKSWKKIHQLVYLIAIFGVLHFIWLVKKDLREPLLYALFLGFLLSIRIFYRFKKSVCYSRLIDKLMQVTQIQ